MKSSMKINLVLKLQIPRSVQPYSLEVAYQILLITEYIHKQFL